jgi:glycosyltransferase involved in cell wall biosynthesis
MGKLGQPKVFVVVPVFQRLAHTLRCIADLEAQTYPNLEVVVVDGGSPDGSVDALRQLPAITVIADIGEQWWTGATWFGVEYALAHGAADDFVMLLNNDTSFAPDMFDVLVAESRRLGAVVAPIAIGTDGTVVNSGVWIDWRTYEITQRMNDAGPPNATWDVDALEGRATLVPLEMVRAAGNVERERLPHYAGDYEFSLRLARRGFPLKMTNLTSVTVDWDVPELSKYWTRASVRRLWWEVTNQRSFVNFRVHFTLIDLAGPPTGQWKLKARWVGRRVQHTVRRNTARDSAGGDTTASRLKRRLLRAS